MERSPRPRKTPINLSQSLQHRLNSYALAASAAGVGMLALAQPAQAKIVYTKSREVLGLYGLHGYTLDLNHDGIGDFTIDWWRSTGARREGLQEVGDNGNRALGGKFGPYALKAGASIGPKGEFRSGTVMLSIGGGTYTSSYGSIRAGYWANVQNAYLGLKFLIKAKIHYGWARLTVKVLPSGVIALLTGYAYETIPNKAIIAGKTHGADDAEQPAPASLTIPAEKPATLGLLALGAPGLSIWKREGSPEAARPRRSAQPHSVIATNRDTKQKS